MQQRRAQRLHVVVDRGVVMSRHEERNEEHERRQAELNEPQHLREVDLDDLRDADRRSTTKAIAVAKIINTAVLHVGM